MEQKLLLLLLLTRHTVNKVNHAVTTKEHDDCNAKPEEQGGGKQDDAKRFCSWVQG